MKTDPEDPDVGQETYKIGINTNGDPAFYYADDPREMPSTEPGLKSRGKGDLYTQAKEEIEEIVDLEDHVGEEVATVTVDVDAWMFSIDYHVDVQGQNRSTLVESIRAGARRLVGGRSE